MGAGIAAAQTAGAAMSGPLFNEQRGDAAVPSQSVPDPPPGPFHFDWGANVASEEESHSIGVGQTQQERDARLAVAAAQVAKDTGQRPDAYYIPLYGAPTVGAPQIDEYHLRQDIAKMPKAQRDSYGIGDSAADFTNQLQTEFQTAKAARAAQIAKGGTVANMPGTVVGTLRSPLNLLTMAVPGFGEWWGAKILSEAAMQAGAQTLETPAEMAEAKAQGGEESWGEAGKNILGAAVGGAVLKGAHLAGGAAVDTALDASRPWRMAQALKGATPEGKIVPPDALAASHVLERQAEVDATNPFQQDYNGIGTHRDNLDAAQQNVAAIPTPGAPNLIVPDKDIGALATIPATAAPGAPIAPPAMVAPRGTGAGFLNQRIVEGLRQRGLSEAQARGVAAGIHAETGGNINAVNRAGGGQGAQFIGQWRGDRLAELQRRYGPNPSLDQQLDYLAWELHGGDPRAARVLQQSDEAGALHSYIHDAMRPGAGFETDRDLAEGMRALGREGEPLPADAPVTEPEAPTPPEVPPEMAAEPEPAPPAAAPETAQAMAEAPPAGVLGELPAAPAKPEVQASVPEPLAVRDQVMRDGLVPVLRQLVGDRAQSLRNLPRLAEDLGVSVDHVRNGLEELVNNGELLSNREDLEKLAKARALEANRQAGAKRKGSVSTKIQPAPVAAEDVLYRRMAQPANRTGDNLLQYIASNGGISPDGLNEAGRALGSKGHDLTETHQKFVPGRGPLIRKTGISVDDMGEKLWDAGYFGPPEVSPRPSEDEVLQKISRAIGGEKTHSFWEDAPKPQPKPADFAAPAPEKVSANHELVQTYETWDKVANHVGMPAQLSLREIGETRKIMAHGTETLPPLTGDEASYTPEELAPYLLEMANREFGDTRGADAEALHDTAVDSGEETYAHYAAATAEHPAADTRPNRPDEGDSARAREGEPGQPGDAGDTREGGAGAGAQQAGAAPRADEAARGEAAGVSGTAPGAAPGTAPERGAERAPERAPEHAPGSTTGLTPAERDIAESHGNFGPTILDTEALKHFDNPAGEGAAKVADDAWHDIMASKPGVERQGVAKMPEGDTRGKGVQYHGARGELPDLTEGYANPNNIYGGHDTFYTTDASDIAGGYQRKKPAGMIYRADEVKPVKTFDMEARQTPEKLAALFGEKWDPHETGFEFEAIERAMADDGKANLREVMDEMRNISSEYGYSKDDVQEIFDTAIHNLQQEGYGAMRHVGGLKTGREPHNVKIYFKAHDQLRLTPVEKAREIPAAGEAAPKEAAKPPAEPPPAEAPAAPAPTIISRETLGIDKGDFNVHGNELARRVSDQVQAALERGDRVIYHVEKGKDVPIVRVENGRMLDEKGQSWGTAPLLMPSPDKEHIRIEPAEAMAKEPAPGGLDLGEKVDPNLAAKQRQELDLAAQQPLRGGRKTGAAQEETLPEGLFGGKIEPELLDQLSAKGLAIDMGDGKGVRPIEEIHAELEDDAKAIDTIESCLVPKMGGGT
jgi:hypothetical protein